ncbi:branched-chain amino acid ABC transporter permease [Sporanaerobacter acetigenes]|uniref:Branched-chain amino acid transport system permease protein n=1 Tax=Sporanaerobacter acetigenes DSM 13106 TaxID=1123281 RepID=A0A1M5W0I1_9FIRM|nr:branched-chain amino acid ABC transporter permease [Sporanaerobacter acetigenes]SHH80724.1 branched-chain amino acid transport system permease protein [Sporanaerobacter acetigenes DSM 13106]
MKGKIDIKKLIVLIVVIAFPLIFDLPRSTMTLLDLAGIWVIVAIGYNLLLGFGGQISLGHAAFVGIGAYITANIAINYNPPLIVGVLLAGVVNGLLGLVLGLPALRLEGNYLAIATLGFGVAFQHIFMEWESFTGGFSGIRNIPPAHIFGFTFDNRVSMYYLIFIFILLAIIISKNILRSKTGRALIAMRDSSIAASSIGVDIAKYKTTAFVLSAIFAGVAGSLYAYLMKQVYPNSFDTAMSLNILAMIVIGGIASIEGSIVGALFITIIPQLLKNIPVQNASFILTGVLLILSVMYFPFGLVQVYHNIVKKIKGSSNDKKGEVATNNE